MEKDEPGEDFLIEMQNIAVPEANEFQQNKIMPYFTAIFKVFKIYSALRIYKNVLPGLA